MGKVIKETQNKMKRIIGKVLCFFGWHKEELDKILWTICARCGKTHHPGNPYKGDSDYWA
jgi:uncharacterized OB-fold protein